MASADIYLDASYRFEMLANKTELQANSRKFFMKLLNTDFNKEEKDDFSFQKFESNVKFINSLFDL